MPIKLIITCNSNLVAKYKDKFTEVENLLTKLIDSDRIRNLETKVVYIDDENSANVAGITKVASVTRKSCKEAIDELYNLHKPAYLVIFGSQDIFPFQNIKNPIANNDNDTDSIVPSDLPYACDTPYSTMISNFTGPSRVVGRIPDIPGIPDIDYLRIVVESTINYISVNADVLSDYFSVSADVWSSSTRESLSNIFGNNANLRISPPDQTGYDRLELMKPIHFFNCHGSPIDSKYYGQSGNIFPTAFDSPEIKDKIPQGTIVAAECCYGAQLYNPKSSDNQALSIANAYFQNQAIAFMGSSTIAYGPNEGQGLADLITQDFIKSILSGASSGRALLEARQAFITAVGPTLDPYELKTLAQFYLLGDPSVQPIIEEVVKSGEDTTENRRLNLSRKGKILSSSVMSAKKVEPEKRQSKMSDKVKEILNKIGFTGNEKEYMYEVNSKVRNISPLEKGLAGGEEITFQAFVQDATKMENNLSVFQVVVIKKIGDAVLGWRVYHKK